MAWQLARELIAVNQESAGVLHHVACCADMWDALLETKALATTTFWACSLPPSKRCGTGPPSKLWPKKATCGLSDEGITPVEVKNFRDPLQTQHLKPLSRIDSQDLIPWLSNALKVQRNQRRLVLIKQRVMSNDTNRTITTK
eukprot:163819-Amphidinium_carterae.1